MKLKRKSVNRVFSKLVQNKFLLITVLESLVSLSFVCAKNATLSSTSSNIQTKNLDPKSTPNHTPALMHEGSVGSQLPGPIPVARGRQVLPDDGEIRAQLREKSKKITSRKARFSSLSNDDSDDHRHRIAETLANDDHNSDNPEQLNVPKEGVAQMTRAARNVERKMDFLTGRVNQIESFIEEDHKVSNGSESSNNENSLEDSPEVGERGATSSPSNVVDNIESPNAQNRQWSTPIVASGLEEEPPRSSDSTSTNKSNSGDLAPGNEWSASVIKSVIPTRQVQPTANSRQDNDSDNQFNQIRDNREVDSDRRQQDLDQQDQVGTGKTANNSPRTNQADANSDNYDNSVSIEDQPARPTGRASNQTTSSRYSANLDNLASSSASAPTTNSDWNSNQNFQLISELIARNEQNVAASQQQRQQNGQFHQQGSGAVAFRPLVGPAAHTNRANRFQNMTVLNSNTDLLNSLSVQQHSQQQSPTDFLTPAPSTSSPTTTTTSISTTTRRPEKRMHGGSVHTYSAGSYGKSSKDLQSRTTSMPQSTSTGSAMDQGDMMSDSNYDSSSNPNPNSNQNNESMRYHNSNQAEQPIRWPVFATSSASNQQPSSESGNGGLTVSQSPFNNRYSPLAPVQSQQQGQQLMTQESGQMEMIQTKTPGDEDLNGGGSAATSVDNSNVVSYQPQQQYRQLQLGSVNRQLDVLNQNLAQDGYRRVAGSSNNNVDGDFSGSPSSLEYDAPRARQIYTNSANNQDQSNVYQQAQDNQQLLSSDGDQQRIRQQQLNRIAAALATQNPLLGNVDLNSILRFQQQKRALAAQLQQQQAANSMDAAAQSYSPSISRAHYAAAPMSELDRLDLRQPAHSVSKRYSPDVYATYLGRNQAANQQQQQPQYAVTDNGETFQLSAASDFVPSTSGASNQQQVPSNQVQQVYQTPSSYPLDYGSSNSRVLRDAYMRALASAATRKVTPLDLIQSGSYMTAASPAMYNPSGSASNMTAYGPAQYTGSTLGSSDYYEPASQKLEPAISQASGGETATAPMSYSSAPYKRSYLNSLFKPSASSRYYYAPTILSPISLEAPAAMQWKYAQPAAIATTDAIQGLYANPYGQYLQNAGVIDPAAQYQAFAAAAAASNLQPHYMDADMAESSLVQSDSTASGSATIASPSQESDGSSSGATSKGGRTGISSWSNIMSLLAGVIPFGVIMALLAPAIVVTGRQKRELELAHGLHNFSDRLKWRPSKVLDSLIEANASKKMLAKNRLDKDKRSLKSTSLGASGGLLKILALSDRSGGAGTSSPSLSIQPNSTTFGNSTGQGSTSVKTKVKKALSALNNFISAAQSNIKRKHRSSSIMSESQLAIPTFFRGVLESMFNFTEVKRQLASVSHTRAVLAQQKLLQQNPPDSRAGNQTSRSQSKGSDSPPDALASAGKRPPEAEVKPSKQVQFKARGSVPEAPLPAAPTTPETRGALVNVTEGDYYKVQVASPVAGAGDLDSLQSGQHKTVIIAGPTTSNATYMPHSATTVSYSNRESPEQLAPSSLIGADVPTEEPATSDTNATLAKHLEVCLIGHLCRLTVKLNEIFRNSGSNQKANRFQQAPGAEHSDNEIELEELTKKYIGQLVEQIEAKNPSALASLVSSDNQAAKQQSRDGHPAALGGMETLYKNAMRNQCYKKYSCAEPLQLKRALSKMRLKLF